MKTKRTEITIETERLLFMSSPKKVFGWCEACGAEAEMVPVDEAALLRRVDSRTIFRWVETERVHSGETANGLLLICLNSSFDEDALPEKSVSQTTSLQNYEGD